MEVKKRAEIITKWIMDYCDQSSFNPKSLVVGISGGIDSSVVSALCAKTGRKTMDYPFRFPMVLDPRRLSESKKFV